ncbi:MAG: type III pantothenate kinase [Phycisphaerae bacterium]|nr:type III pantothenate kinase [Phycisphaerae bacterium]
MNMIAVDIGNTSITVALFIDNDEKFIESVRGGSDDAKQRLTDLLSDAWQRVPLVQDAAAAKRDGVIVASSVNPPWTDMIAEICKTHLDEKLKVIGKDVPLPIDTAVDNALEVGTDRLVAAAAAFAVVQDAVVVADFGTAVTIDLVDENGTFMGGVIYPGFEILAKALHENTAALPTVHCKKPKGSYGANTIEAINAGMYYAAVGLLETITRRYAEELGKWPQTVVTGGAATVIAEDCEFVDTWVSNLTVRGVVIAWKKYIEDQAYLAGLGEEDEPDR